MLWGIFFHALLSLEKALKAWLALSKFSTWKSREGRRHPQAGDLQAINEIYFEIFGEDCKKLFIPKMLE